jgi:transposase
MTKGNAERAIRKHVGLDVHKASIALAVADSDGGEVRDLGVIEHDAHGLLKRLQALGKPEELHVVYEAGPTGYGLVRLLREPGYQADVVAPSLTPRAPGERVKTDRRDARKLTRLARAGELRYVVVPDARDEAIRDLSRAREDAVKARLVVRQQINALLLRHGIVYPERTRWSKAHMLWLRKQSMAHPAQQVVLDEALQSLASVEGTLDRLTRGLHEHTASWRFRRVVEALMGLRGLDTIGAIALVAEIGDIGRFEHPRELMAWLGLVPSEYSSGPRVRRGSITKAGNTHARRMLVEAAWHHRFRARIGPNLQRRLKACSDEQQRLSWKAQQRLCQRFANLQKRGLQKNKINVAIARELAGFVWAMARTVPVTT